MKLAELDPTFWTLFGSERKGMGVSFECPLCVLEGRPSEKRGMLSVAFRQPLDGGEPVKGMLLWDRTGDTFETLTLSPSLDASSHDHGSHKGWHGHVQHGELKGGGA